MSRKAPPKSKAAPAAVNPGWRDKHPIDGRWGEGAATALDTLRQIERSRTPAKDEPDTIAPDKPLSP